MLWFPIKVALGQTEGYTYEISYDGLPPESALATRFNTKDYPGYIHLTRNVLTPQAEYAYSGSALFARLYLVGGITKLPILFALWLAYSIFKEISKTSTPFTKVIFRKLHFLGFVVILIGIFNNSFFATVINTILLGTFSPRPVINYYLILMGFIIYVVSEILQYGTYLQSEMDTLL